MSAEYPKTLYLHNLKVTVRSAAEEERWRYPVQPEAEVMARTDTSENEAPETATVVAATKEKAPKKPRKAVVKHK